MKHEILASPTYAMLEVELSPGERFVSESGAMAWMDENVKMETSSRGGGLAGLKRKLLAGESFFQNTYSVDSGTGTIAFAPRSAGDIAEGMPEFVRDMDLPKFKPGGLNIVRAGGEAGLFSAIVGGWLASGDFGSSPVTMELQQ